MAGTCGSIFRESFRGAFDHEPVFNATYAAGHNLRLILAWLAMLLLLILIAPCRLLAVQKMLKSAC